MRPTLPKHTSGFAAALFCALLALTAPRPALAHFEPVTCKNSFTPEQEIAEGRKVAAQVYRQMPVLPENDPITQYVQNLGARLAQFAPPTPGLTQKWPFNFHVVASDEINAFALPGGSIFVNLGTVQAADTEAQLAGVMAHEISHVVMRHSTCNLSKQRSRSIFYGLGALGSAILLGNGAAGQLAQQGIGMGQSLDFLHMSRGDEQQADLLGTDILYNAGYDPRGLPQFFETIQAKYGAGGAQFLSDHPNPGNRTEYVNREIATLPRRPDWTVTSAEFKRIHAVAAGRKALTSKQVQAGAWRSSGQYAAGPGSNGAVIPSGPGGQASAAPAAPLTRQQLGLDGRMGEVRGPNFRLRAPSGWQGSAGEGNAFTLAPPGGAGSFGLSYGVLVDTVNASGARSLRDATAALVSQLTQGNSGLEQIGQITDTQAAGRPACSVFLRGASPVTDGGAALPERDWLLAVSRPDGALNYLVFVAPERDFATLKPTFETMLAGFAPL